SVLFFFQAEDGIRDFHVTGVQTCALPISQQLYAMPAAGGEPRQLTGFALDVGSYRLSPDGSRVAFSADTFADCAADLACTKKKLDRKSVVEGKSGGGGGPG